MYYNKNTFAHGESLVTKIEQLELLLAIRDVTIKQLQHEKLQMSVTIEYQQKKIKNFTVRVKSQFCDGMSQHGRCSANSACACFHIAGAMDIGICSDELFVDCSELITCEQPSNVCHEPNHRCVHHPRCRNLPVCYPIPSFNQQLCPALAHVQGVTESSLIEEVQEKITNALGEYTT
ncbi:unnamed protein product, partial [Rotaria sordida]